MARYVVIVTSDEHAGHRLGLCNPNAVLPADNEVGRPEPAKPQLGPFQKLLWEYRVEQIEQAKAFAGNDPIILKNLGDMTHGRKHTDGLMTNRLADQVLIARANAMHIVEALKPTHVYMSAGTNAHTFGDAGSETLIAGFLKDKFPDLAVELFYHGLVDIDGVQIDYKHHGPGPGIRDWTRGNQVLYHLKDLIYRQRSLGEQPARIYLSGHYHSFVWITHHQEWDGELLTYDYITLPSYCGLGSYGHQATRSVQYQDFGLLAIEIVDGEVGRIKPIKKRLDIRSRSTVNDES